MRIGRAAYAGAIASLEEGRVELREVSTELRAVEVVIFMAMD
jgi:hypothetical protein